MDFKIKDLMKETNEPFRRGYWKITAVSFLLIMLSAGIAYSGLISSVNEIPELVRNIIANEFAGRSSWDMRMAAIVLTLVGGMLVLSLVVKFLLDVFLDNPIRVGADRMFLDTVEEPEKPILLARLAFAFDADYINTVKVMFLKTLFVNLWMILLIVPGIVKAYQYRMVPYLLAEDPYMPHKQALATSKEMMKGWKAKAFLLDLYFIPWEILGLLTLSVLSIFYVEPKKNLANTVFYMKVRNANLTGGEQ